MFRKTSTLFSLIIVTVLVGGIWTDHASAKEQPAPLKVGVLVYGAGMMDGSEIQEVVLTLLALDTAGAQVTVFAPDANQVDVVDHMSNQAVAGETRNMLTEAARISHGGVVAVADAKAESLDAMIIPGGLGFIKGITTFGTDGANMSVMPEVAKLLRDLHQQRKPIGFWCITPVLAAKLFGNEKPRLTIGADAGIAAQIEAMGGKHVVATAKDIVVDESARLVSSPAYMVGPSIAPVAMGITRGVHKVLDLARGHHTR